jgi:hypothetical protein
MEVKGQQLERDQINTYRSNRFLQEIIEMYAKFAYEFGTVPSPATKFLYKDPDWKETSWGSSF